MHLSTKKSNILNTEERVIVNELGMRGMPGSGKFTLTKYKVTMQGVPGNGKSTLTLVMQLLYLPLI